MRKHRLHNTLLAALCLSGGFMSMHMANACTRVVYLGLEDTIITARSMDWPSDAIESNLWAFPRGMQRDGAAGSNAIRWTSRYGSVVVTAFEAATVDGMNERGLVANLLSLTESQYPLATDSRLPMSISVWAQFVLDNYGSVAEAVASMRLEQYYVLPAILPDGRAGTSHLSLSDPTGDSAIIEYIGGNLTIYHGREYQVMTNSPTYDQQLALNAYWQSIGGDAMLPGTHRGSDRLVRAFFYINAIPKTLTLLDAVASTFSVIRNVSVPLGMSTPKQADISTTIWRTVSDHKNKRYYFESTRSPNVFWVDMADIDFSWGQPAKRLTLTDGAVFAGNTAGLFVYTEPFKFLTAIGRRIPVDQSFRSIREALLNNSMHGVDE